MAHRLEALWDQLVQAIQFVDGAWRLLEIVRICRHSDELGPTLEALMDLIVLGVMLHEGRQILLDRLCQRVESDHNRGFMMVRLLFQT